MFLLNLKAAIRKVAATLGLDLTQNLKYDRLTGLIIEETLAEGGVGIDVGCHKGEIFDLFIKYSPEVAHYGFEPLPHLYTALKSKYHQHHILPFALAEAESIATFNYVKNAPAYSGLIQRKYDIPNPLIEEIKVEVKRLDDLIHDDQGIAILKIDVEGAEMGVLLGAKNILAIHRPIVLFEFGLGASDVYGTSPEEMFSFFADINYAVYKLEDYLKKPKIPLTISDFKNAYHNQGEFYFIAKVKIIPQ